MLGLGACASTGEAGDVQATGRDQNRLTRAEIEAANVATLYDVVQRLRPRWLQVRGARTLDGSLNIVVFQGQTYLGEVGVLREIDPSAADALRYLDGQRAQATLPGLTGRIVEGAIIIDLRAR
jgi:hypothetical protein